MSTWLTGADLRTLPVFSFNQHWSKLFRLCLFIFAITTFINDGYFSILLSSLKFAWLASFGLKYSFEFFTQKQGQVGKLEYRQKNTKIAAIYESGLLYDCLRERTKLNNSMQGQIAFW